MDQVGSTWAGTQGRYCPWFGQYCPHGSPFRGDTEGGLRAYLVVPVLLSRVVGGASHIPPHCSCSTVSYGLLATWRGQVQLRSDCALTRARSHCESGRGFVSAAARPTLGPRAGPQLACLSFSSPLRPWQGAGVRSGVALGAFFSPGVTEERSALDGCAPVADHSSLTAVPLWAVAVPTVSGLSLSGQRRAVEVGAMIGRALYLIRVRVGVQL